MRLAILALLPASLAPAAAQEAATGGATASAGATAERSDTRLPPLTVTAPRRSSRPASSAADGRTSRGAEPAPTPVAAGTAPATGLMLSGPGGEGGPGRGQLSTAASAQPAASTTLDSAWISRTPVSTYGDLFRSVPGMNVSNFGQGAIGYGISMRGFNEGDHGRDVAYAIDGVPVNIVSSLHIPSYADLNPLIPETVRSIEIIRGPFSVEFGDANVGGSVNIVTKRSEPFATVTASGGSFATGRGLATISSQGGAFEPYVAWEGYRTDGYRDNSFIDRYNGFNKVSTRVGEDGVLSLRVQAYGTDFGAASYISRDAVRAGTLSPKTAINDTDGGNRYYENIVANYVSGATDQELSGVLFVSHDTFNRWSDFGSGQRWQNDERVTAGGTIRKVWTGAVSDVLPVQILAGGNWRTDLIDSFQGRTVARHLTTAQLSAATEQTNLAGFAQLQVKPTEWLKITGGGRFDQFYYDVTDNLTPANSITTSPGVLSPKAGLSITPLSWLELYGNYGQGFRSYGSTELIDNPALKPFKIESQEAGARLVFDRVSIQGDVWTTTSENESFQAAPSLPVTYLGAARRDGFDIDTRFALVREPGRNIALFANYGGVRAVLLDAAPSYYVPNVPSYVANLGIDFDVATRGTERLYGSAYVTFVGKKNLTQDGLLSTEPYSRVTGRLAYAWAEGWTAFTQATWYPGDTTSEIALNFGDVVNASSADIYTSPQARLAVTAGLIYRFDTPAFGTATPLPTTKMVVK
ncbi:TonB-dependent receptor [Rhodoplanes sp. TEM]|uniref:TonB-dependent receptor n=1 Tax=Rhodoplanes tepidamans TaxID=200616 RepID=A0ABT5J4A2_RHOTP|nr:MULTISPECIES: TonB-dependent receptor [Rhodoplanes]MDC7784465.1 TonB-dependent receptor [Rhodoplanes tepidamans]MDC7983495.1 TonB-dependent receptor [Rhodoplanes sp. TEM]MDQ0356973.1 outer membrane receptor protein involved in Fe transport [Rhodoplanes tepidamans]